MGYSRGPEVDPIAILRSHETRDKRFECVCEDNELIYHVFICMSVRDEAVRQQNELYTTLLNSYSLVMDILNAGLSPVLSSV